MLGVVTYTLVAGAYEEYYRAFGLSLNDVGLGYAPILYSAVGVFAGAAFITAVIAGAVLAIAPASLERGTRQPGLRVIGVALLCVVLVLGIVYQRLHAEAHGRGVAALDGESVRPVSIGPAPLLNLRGQRARVAWLNPKHRPRLPTRVLYLATSNSNHLLWNYRTQELMSVPAAAVTLHVFAEPL